MKIWISKCVQIISIHVNLLCIFAVKSANIVWSSAYKSVRNYSKAFEKYHVIFDWDWNRNRSLPPFERLLNVLLLSLFGDGNSMESFFTLHKFYKWFRKLLRKWEHWIKILNAEDDMMMSEAALKIQQLKLNSHFSFQLHRSKSVSHRKL